MKLSLVLEAIDRMSGPARRAQGSVRQLGAGFDGMRRAAVPAGAATARVERITNSLPASFGRAAAAARHFAGTRGLAAIHGAAYKAGFAIGALARKAGSLAIGGAGGLAIGAGAAAVGGMGMLIKGTIETGAEFEHYQAILEGTERSAAGARKAMDWVAKFAAATPYEIGEVTDAFVRARSMGIDPLNGSLNTLGDAAAARGAQFVDAIEMMADAQTGEFERLKSFGITGSSKGSSATFSYVTKAGKNASKTVKKDMASIREAVLSILSENYGGGMVRQSKTLLGIWANLKDKVTLFELAIARAGFFDRIKADLQSVLDWTDRIATSGAMEAWAKRISDSLVNAWEWAKRFAQEPNWQEVGVTARDVGVAIWGVAKALAAAARFAVNLNAGLRSLPQPPAWIGKLDSGARSVLTTPFSEWFKSSAQPSAPPKALSPARQPARPAPRMTQGQRDVWSRALTAPRGTLGSAPQSKVDLNIHFSGKSAAEVNVQRLKATPGANVTVNRGWAMRGNE